RLEQGRLKFEPEAFGIKEVVTAVLYELKAVAKEKGVQLKVAPGIATAPPIFADKNRVKQIVYNLVGNALKFTDTGAITLDARVEGKLLKTLVTDSGPGISKDDQRLLFRKFRQVGSTANSLTRELSRGTGLGLYISKLLCDQMGGWVALEHSELGQGTTFSFSLPLDAAKPTAKPDKPAPKPVGPTT